MLEREYQGQNWSVTRALEVLDKLRPLLTIRYAFLGLRR
jgi:hypothetical protein